jgi:hypothetical protein
MEKEEEEREELEQRGVLNQTGEPNQRWRLVVVLSSKIIISKDRNIRMTIFLRDFKANMHEMVVLYVI